jgi:putative endopeptidase
MQKGSFRIRGGAALGALGFGFSYGCGASQPAPAPAPPVPTAIATAATAGKPRADTTLAQVGLDAAAMDKSADPCKDFYQFACGGWLKKTEIPGDKARWSRSFNEIHQRNEADLRKILETAAASTDPDPARKKLGAYWTACMDEAGIEKAGTKPIDKLVAKAKALKDTASLSKLVTELHKVGIWVLFDTSAEQDFKDATRYIGYLDQGGLGLPDRDYYLKDDEKSKELRNTYLGHVERMFALSGLKEAAAKQAAQNVMKIETELAKVSKTRVERRDPKGLYNKIDRTGVERTTPRLDWKRYFEGLGHSQMEDLNVTSVKFFEGLNELLGSIKPAEWQSYFVWHIVRATAPALPKAFVDESFRMEQALTGQKEQRVRWKRCVESTDHALGELLAQPFVAERFSGDSKPAAEAMVKEISAAFSRELERVGWMDAATRELSRKKLAAMAYLIGYPKVWRTYDFEVKRDPYMDNLLAARAFDLQFQLNKIGKPVNRDEWEMTPPTVNAYYHPLKNQMVFPAGILQPPFYSVESSAAVNLGGMGMVVGHELTHGFDDEGSQFDKDGNLSDWWSVPIRDRFKTQTGCVERQYGNYEALPGLKLNGQLTLGENIADMGGVKLALYAYRTMRAAAPEEQFADGFSEDQQFFLATGQVWCSKYREEYARMTAQVDPHSPPRFRVNGSIANLPEFTAAFSCAPSTPMNPPNKCAVW